MYCMHGHYALFKVSLKYCCNFTWVEYHNFYTCTCGGIIYCILRGNIIRESSLYHAQYYKITRPEWHWYPQMACDPNSISHTLHIQNSTHHFLLSTCENIMPTQNIRLLRSLYEIYYIPQELSSSLVPSLLMCSSYHQSHLVLSQNQQSDITRLW